VFYSHSITTPIKPCTKDHSRSNGAQRTLDRLKNTFCLVSLYLIRIKECPHFSRPSPTVNHALLQCSSLVQHHYRHCTVSTTNNMTWSAKPVRIPLTWLGQLSLFASLTLPPSLIYGGGQLSLSLSLTLPDSSAVVHLWWRVDCTTPFKFI
jgi:hypothetical protein